MQDSLSLVVPVYFAALWYKKNDILCKNVNSYRVI